MPTQRRVLVVEDSPAQAARVTADLQNDGFDVTLAIDGEAALECLTSHDFDVVLSDVVMPGIDGYELCRRIKDLDVNLPVILLTSLDDPIEIVHGLDAGADNFLRKPYDAAQLVSRVNTMLYHRAMRGSGKASMGLEVMLHDKRFLITAERQQILDLLISSFEDLVTSNRELHDREDALRAAQGSLEAQLAATEQERRRLEAVLGAAPHAIVILDTDGTITDVSDSMCSLLAADRATLLGREALDVFHLVAASGEPLSAAADSLAAVLATGEPIEIGTNFDLFLKCGDRTMPVIARAAAVRDAQGQTAAIVGSLHDIGTLAAHDSVTKLPHQALFADRVARAASTIRPGRWMAVIAVSIDSYARLCEHLSNVQTQELLASVAEHLRSALADPDSGSATGSAGYFGHDAFALVLPDLDDELDGVHYAERLVASIAADELLVSAHALPLTVTAGVVVGGATGDPIELVAAAVSAARRAQVAGGNRVQVADASVDARANDWLRHQAELRDAIDQDQLVVHYQPELDLRTERLWGVEALVRWQHPERGLLPPSEFLPLADETGLMARLGWWVLREACRQTAEWRQSAAPGARVLTVSVNLDASQLTDPAIATHVSGILDDTGLEPSALLLEITENGVMADALQAAERLREIKALGVQTAIDDFGTGYSSLVQLRRLPVDFLKIDRAFVDGMTTEPEDATIVAATIRLGRALGIDTVAEGVETEDQLVQLRMLGCDYAQGFHWAPPMAPVEFERWWASWSPAELHRPEPEETIEDEASASLDDVLAYLVHELRSPLTVIAGYAELALHANEEDAPKFIESISRGARDLDQRISTLADARDAGRGAMRLRLEEVELGGLAQALVNDLTPQLAPHPITVRVEDELIVRADGSRLAQAITNLLVNAAKFSPSDEPIEVIVTAPDGIGLVSVRDHGPGVPAERRSELFRRFSRLGSRHVGMGVGLHLVRTIARAHGGDASYEPAPDGGSRFTISIPASSSERTDHG